MSFSMQVSGSLSGVSDAFGFLQNGDLTAELDIDGTPVLFDLDDGYETLAELPSQAGINNQHLIYGPSVRAVPILRGVFDGAMESSNTR
jgi:hypothetical protein